MPDEIDQINDRMDAEMALFEKKRRESFVAPVPVYHRFCLYCQDDTENGNAYCCEDCEIDDIRLKKAQQRNGKMKR
jgi:predicted nucleic acid-binding Zn ribbon protein